MTTLARSIRVVAILASVFYFLVLVFRVVGGLPGAPQSGAARDGLKTKQDLFQEMSNLRNEDYSTFGRAASLQANAQYQVARETYEQLRHAQTVDGKEIDLLDRSETVSYNFRRLPSSAE